MKGKFIAIEGLEGAGKSNAKQVVANWLNQQNIAFICVREPGGTPIAEALRQLWKQGVDGEFTTDKTELLMMYASRTQLTETIIQPTLQEGKWVISDRYNLSTLAYQGGGRGIDEHLIKQIKQAVLGDFAPDFTLYLDIDPVIGLQRARGRGELDRIEQQHIDFFHRVRERYLALVETDSTAVKINANLPIEQVSTQIENTLTNWKLSLI